MNVLPLLSVILGIISVLITINYINHYNKLNYSLNKISANCVNDTKKSNEIQNIQDNLDLNDYDFNKLIKTHKNKIINILKQDIKESFTNYKYIDHKQRELDNFKFTNLIN